MELFLKLPPSSSRLILSASLRISVAVTDEGYTNFEPQEKGRDIVLSVDSVQRVKILNYFVDLISRPPKSQM